MTEDELDDPKNIKCECGVDIRPVLIIIDEKWMCADCIQKLLNKIRKEFNSIADEIEDEAAALWRADENDKTIERMDSWVKRIKEITKKKE